MQPRTTLMDRHYIVALKRVGHSYTKIASLTGWSYELVRKVCRAFRDHGEAGLAATTAGRPTTGRLSTFPWRVRYVALRLKRQRPHSGPDVIRAEMAVRPSLSGEALPSAASLSAYFSGFGERLLTPRRHVQLPRQSSTLAPVRAVHECWLLDFDERLAWRGVGYTNVMNVVDLFSGLKIASCVHAAGSPQQYHLIGWEQIRDDLRQAFQRWGLPDRIRTDHDRRLVAEGNYPVPMPFTLWLVGLGIQHELIQRVTQNGGVERSHRTWEARLLDVALGSEPTAVQDYVNYALWQMNVVLPSRGRQCRRRPPLLVYPQARTPRRPYSSIDELVSFELARVEDYLAAGRWLRRTSSKGQFHFQSELLSVKRAYARQVVAIIYNPCDHRFEVSPAQSNEVLLTFQPNWLSIQAITGLSLSGV